MPGGDGTGPMGMGAMTGRAAGYCAGNSVPGYMTPGVGRGWGMGVGRGRRFGRGLGLGFRGGRAWGGYAPYGVAQQAVAPWTAGPTPEQELNMLKGQSEYFAGALDDIKKRIEELHAAQKSE